MRTPPQPSPPTGGEGTGTARPLHGGNAADSGRGTSSCSLAPAPGERIRVRGVVLAPRHTRLAHAGARAARGRRRPRRRAAAAARYTPRRPGESPAATNRPPAAPWRLPSPLTTESVARPPAIAIRRLDRARRPTRTARAALAPRPRSAAPLPDSPAAGSAA